MLLLTSAPTKLDNILTISLVALLALVIVIAIIRKAMLNKKAASADYAAAEEAVQEAPQTGPLAPGCAGKLKLHNVEPKVAAMAMAIVADKLGKPINELRFISIKEVE